jgi:A1 cistron-splicing factor AAR2
LIRRILPNNGKVSHLPEKSAQGKDVEKEENMDFTPFDLRKSFPAGATGMDITRWSLDKSWLTKDLLSRVYHDGKVYTKEER